MIIETKRRRTSLGGINYWDGSTESALLHLSPRETNLSYMAHPSWLDPEPREKVVPGLIMISEQKKYKKSTTTLVLRCSQCRLLPHLFRSISYTNDRLHQVRHYHFEGLGEGSEGGQVAAIAAATLLPLPTYTHTHGRTYYGIPYTYVVGTKLSHHSVSIITRCSLRLFWIPRAALSYLPSTAKKSGGRYEKLCHEAGKPSKSTHRVFITRDSTRRSRGATAHDRRMEGLIFLLVERI